MLFTWATEFKGGKELEMKGPFVPLCTRERFGQMWVPYSRIGGQGLDHAAELSTTELGVPKPTQRRGREKRWDGERKPRATVAKCKFCSMLGELACFCKNCRKGCILYLIHV